MDKSFEDNSALNCSLSQSYNDGIQKIVGSDQAILVDFELPQHIVEKRQSSWNILFQKYSTMVSEVVFNIRTMKPEEAENMEEDIEDIGEPRMPMRKSMSMVQYWVDTGNQPYMKNCNDKTHSDPGSSIAEEEILELDKAASPSSVNMNSSLQKRTEAAGFSNSKLMRIVSSSSSSVDTAAYILANNNTTKKAETLVILEGSKVVDKKQNNVLQSLNFVSSVNNINTNGEKIEMQQKHFMNKDTVKRRSNASKVSPLKENVNKTNNDPQEFNADATKMINVDSNVGQVNDLPSTLVSESDESVIKKGFGTAVQRKKLYNNTESPAEFTPVSDAASSYKAPRLSMRQYGHPAFQTPKLSRSTYSIKKARQRLKRKKIRNLLSSTTMSSFKTNGNKSAIKDNNGTQKNISNSFKTRNGKDKSKISFLEGNTNQNKLDKNRSSESLYNNSNDNRLIQQPLDRRKNSDVTKSVDHNNRFNLKTLYLTLHRLPYIYGNTKDNSGDVKNSRNEIPRQEKEKRFSFIQNGTKDLNTTLPDDESSNNPYQNSTESRKRCIQSPAKQATPTNTKNSNSNTKIEKVLASKESENKGESSISNTSSSNSKKSKSDFEKEKSPFITSQNNSPVAKSNKNKDTIVFDKSVKYVLVLSSSDESEAIVPVLRTRLKKGSLKRKTSINEKLDDNSEDEAKKILLNSTRKKSNSKLKSTESKSPESEEVNASNSAVDHQTISSSAVKEQISPVMKKLVKSKMKGINNKDKTSVVSPRAKTYAQYISNALSNEKEQAKIESQNKNENEVISDKMINKPLKKINKINNLNDLVNKIKSKSNDDKDSRDSLFNKKQENSTKQSQKSFDEGKKSVIKKIKLSDKKSEQNKETILDEDCQNLKETTSKRGRRKSKRDTNKTNTSKRKTDEFLILSDDECIIPLKMKAQGE